MDFNALVSALVDHPAAAIAAAEALALTYLFKELMKSQAANLQTALSIAPVAMKLAEGTDALERMMARAERGTKP